jgi:hypothetical protein
VFERFTDRSRRVLVLAQEEAYLLNHNFIGTEHLLLGLLHEDEGLAAQALKSLGVSYEAVFAMVEETIGPRGSARTHSPAFTPRSKKVLGLSLREARQLGHEYIGTEHLLLGLIREGEGVAVQILQSIGVPPSRIRQQVVSLLNGSEPAASEPAIPLPAVPFEGHQTPLLREIAQRIRSGGSDWTRSPTRVLPGPEHSLGSDELSFRVVGVSFYEEGVEVLWRMFGISKPIADWMGDPAAFVALRDDVGTAYTAVEPRMAAQSETEYAGSSIFAPGIPASVLQLIVVWQGETIDIEVPRRS